MFPKWVFTVAGLSTSSAAISRPLRPLAARVRTPSSRAVRRGGSSSHEPGLGDVLDRADDQLGTAASPASSKRRIFAAPAGLLDQALTQHFRDRRDAGRDAELRVDV